MTNYSLFRKTIELLELIKNHIEEGHYYCYKESLSEMFYENDTHLRQDLLEIIPVKDLEKVKNLLFFIGSIRFDGNIDGETYLTSGYPGGKRKKEELLSEISDFQELIRKQCNVRFNYGVFYSWQSDLDYNCNRSLIEEALEEALENVNNGKDGPYLSLDKDTKGIAGSPDITPAILQKIDRSICFVADVTPVANLENKIIPNPNVMFELGYALSSLSYERLILVCNTCNCNTRELPFDLGLKRVIDYQYDMDMPPEIKQQQRKRLVDHLEAEIAAIADL